MTVRLFVVQFSTISLDIRSIQSEEARVSIAHARCFHPRCRHTCPDIASLRPLGQESCAPGLTIVLAFTRHNGIHRYVYSAAINVLDSRRRRQIIVNVTFISNRSYLLSLVSSVCVCVCRSRMSMVYLFGFCR